MSTVTERRDIDARVLGFTCRIVKLVREMPRVPGAVRVANQLVAAAGAVGANLIEARAASTRREFLRFNEISLRESRETIYWLTICERVCLVRPDVCRELLDEAHQITRIVAKIVITTKKNGVRSPFHRAPRLRTLTVDLDR